VDGVHRTVTIKKIYDKVSHFKKHDYAPVHSQGIYKDGVFAVTVRMTPELRSHSTERNVLLKHEKREAKILATGKSVDYAHRVAASKDPEWLKGEKGYSNVWKRLGHKEKRW